MCHIGTGNAGVIVSTVAAVGFHGLSSFRYHEMNRIGLSFIIAWLWQGFGKEICAAVKIGDKMGNGRKERGFAEKRMLKVPFAKIDCLTEHAVFRNLENRLLTEPAFACRMMAIE